MVQFYMSKSHNNTITSNLNVYKVDNSKFKFSIENNGSKTDINKDLDDIMDDGSLPKKVDESSSKSNSDRFLLFHGTRISSLSGILMHGFKLNLLRTDMTGRAFGNGTYFTDQYSMALG